MKSAILSAAALAALLATGAVAQTQQPQSGGSAPAGSGQQSDQGATTAPQGATTQDATTQGAAGQGTGTATTCAPGQPNCPAAAGASGGSGATVQSPGAQPGGAGEATQNGDQTDAGGQAQPDAAGDQAEQGQADGDAAAGQRAGGGERAEITTEQQTVIRERIMERDYDRVSVDFEINIGIGVPQTIVLHPLPPEIVEIVPVYEGYRFFILADGTIVIVDPVDYVVVYVIYV